MERLYFVVGQGFPRRRRVNLPRAAEIVLGREKTCHLRLDDPRLSRRHCTLATDADKGIVHVKDLVSANGTFVNRHRIEEALMRPGDRLYVGGYVLELLSETYDPDKPEEREVDTFAETRIMEECDEKEASPSSRDSGRQPTIADDGRNDSRYVSTGSGQTTERADVRHLLRDGHGNLELEGETREFDTSEIHGQFDSAAGLPPAIMGLPPVDFGRDEFVGVGIGPYAVLRIIGEGHLCRVYEVEHSLMKQRFALKLLRPEYSQDKRREAVFQESARKAAALVHPNIVQLKNAGADAGRFYLVLDYIRGADLRRIITQMGPLPTVEVMRIARHLTTAMAYAHSLGIHHGSLTASDVLMGEDGTPYLGDFGLGAAREDLNYRLDATDLDLDPEDVAFTPPEFIRETVQATEAGDVYRLGAVLYQAATGHPPAEGKTLPAVCAAVVTGRRRPTAKTMPDPHEGLAAVIEKALAPNPTDRYDSAVAMRHAVQALSSKRRTEAE